MNTLKLLLRFIYIHYVVVKYGLDRVMLRFKKLGPLRFVIYLNPLRWLFKTKRSRGERLRLALEALGPIYVKFGQILSVRYDLLPNDIILELSKLQDSVPPFPGEKAWKLLQASYEESIEHYFYAFDKEPLASASIAQVHKATLHDGQTVAVKILRPHIREVIEDDVALLYLFAGMLETLWKDSKRVKPREIVEEFERTIYDELDLYHEAANASQLKRNFKHSQQMYVPEVYWPYIRQNVMVTEYVHGIPVHKIDELKQHQVNLKYLAENGVTIFFTQVFRDCFFHADLHPGNLLVDVSNPQKPRYIVLDFGIMGALSPYDQQYLAENMVAFFRRNYRQVAQLHIDSGWVDPDTRVEEFESMIRTVCEPVFERPLRKIYFGHLLAKLFKTAKRFNMEVQPQLLLLQKTLLNVESLGRRLYPDLNLWDTAKPFLEDWVKQQTGLRYWYNHAKERAPYWVRQFAEMPDLVYQKLQEDAQPKQALKRQEKPHLADKQMTKKVSKGHWLMAIGLVLAGYGFVAKSWHAHWELTGNDYILLAGGAAMLIGLWRHVKT